MNGIQPSIDAAARMGRRAGQAFLDTGIWPMCPFALPGLEQVALAWTDAVFAVVGPHVAPPDGAAQDSGSDTST